MKRSKAIVIGGGFSGLLASRVLSEHFDSVLVMEKDPAIGSAQPRAGAAQGAHLHVLLQRGQEILKSLFPGIEEIFLDALCPRIDWAADTRWETASGAFPRYPSATKTLSISRPMLESTVHALVSKRANISFRNSHVDKIFLKDGSAAHVECLDQAKHHADLIVLAGGQHFPVNRILAPLPIDEYSRSLPIRITYRSAIFRTDSLRFGNCKQYYYQLSPARDPIGAVICPMENGRSVATIVEYGASACAPMDLAGFRELAESVPGGNFAAILREGVPLSGISVFHKPSMYLRLLHKVPSFPGNVFALGDAFCSLNPVFGQGMTIALEQALLLQRGLKKKDFRASGFHRDSARRLRLPFLLSKFGSSIEGGFAERYLQNFLLRSQGSPRLHRKFLKVLHLKASYGSLLDPIALGSSFRAGRAESHG